MKMRTGIIVTLGCLVLTGCQPTVVDTSPSPQEYAVAFHGDSIALTQAGEQWGQAISPWLLGEEADVKALIAAEKNIAATIETLRGKLEAREIPDDPRAKEYAELGKDYLNWQDEMLPKYVAWRGIVESENPAIEATRQVVIDDLRNVAGEESEWQVRLNGLAEDLGVTIGF